MYQIKEVQESDDNRIRRYRRWKDSYEQKRSDGQMMSIIGDKNVALRKELGELRKSLLIMKETNKSLVKEKNNLTDANAKLLVEISRNKHDMHRVSLLKDSISTLIAKHKKTKEMWHMQEKEIRKQKRENERLLSENKKLRKENAEYRKITPVTQANTSALSSKNKQLEEEISRLKILAKELRATAHNNLKYALAEKAVNAREGRKLESAKDKIDALKQLTMEMAASMKYHDGRGLFKNRRQLIKSLEVSVDNINPIDTTNADSLISVVDSADNLGGLAPAETETSDSDAESYHIENGATGSRRRSKLLKSYPTDIIYELESHLIDMSSPTIYYRDMSSSTIHYRDQESKNAEYHLSRMPENVDELQDYVDEYVEDGDEQDNTEDKALVNEVERLNELLQHADNLNKSIDHKISLPQQELEHENDVEEYKALVKHHSKSLIDLSALSEIRGKSGNSVGF
eukprot:g2684.t1